MEIFSQKKVIFAVKYILPNMAEDLNRLKVVLAEKKKTNKWLSEQIEIGQSTISKWCTNKSQPSLDVLIKIANALSVSLDELVRREGASK